jgi:CRISPR-associated protein Cmr2
MAKSPLVYPDMPRYIAITFAPVQSFIEKSRKLRDLYGSSFILSFLAKAICQCAENHTAHSVIVPDRTSFTRGVANVIYLYLSVKDPTDLETEIKKAFHQAWKDLVHECRTYIQERCKDEFAAITNPENSWDREWNLWANHAWELFIVCGEENDSLETVRGQMATRKQARDWIGLNWRGESSSISGTDAVAYPTMASFNPKPKDKDSYEHSIGAADKRIEKFFETLSALPENTADEESKAIVVHQKRIPEKAIDPNEKLSIPELIKRFITYPSFIDSFHKNHPNLPSIERLPPFTKLQRREENRWTGWFQGDGDRMGAYIESLVKEAKNQTEQNQKLQEFSSDMLQWGEALQEKTDGCLENGLKGRIVYAGGDDFFGVLHHDDDSLTPEDCLKQFWYHFDNLWGECGHDISVSTGFVWAAPNVPQRDLLQHLRQTEKAAKNAGRDRLAIRILFNSGNHLDWQCPWRYLEKILEGYRDRSGGQNWTHIHSDIAILEARHAFSDSDRSVAQAIFNIYFPKFKLEDNDERLWTPKPPKEYKRLQSGLLGLRPLRSGNEPSDSPPSPKQLAAENKCFNQWVIDLAQVGFHLFPDRT